MKGSGWWSLLGLAVCACAMAAEPHKTVGTATLIVDDQLHARKFDSELWFEAAPGSKVEDFAVRPPLRAIGIARQAEPAPGLHKRPLIVISHGNWGTRYSQGWLAMRLVDAGYVVLSTSHPGTLGDDQTAAGRLRLWTARATCRSRSACCSRIRSGPRSSTNIASVSRGIHSAAGPASALRAGASTRHVSGRSARQRRRRTSIATAH